MGGGVHLILAHFAVLIYGTIIEEKVPKDIQEIDLSNAKTPATLHRIINNEFLQSISERNGGKPPEASMRYRQLYNFVYADNAKMITVGGIISSNGQQEQVDMCRFGDLPFIKAGEEPF